VKVNTSVLTTDLEVVSAAVQRRLPAVEASHTEMCVMVSVVVMVNAGELERAIAPLEAAENVADWRVVTADAFAVPAAPGSPVWSLMYVAAGAVNATARSILSQLFASVVVANPTVILTP